MAVKVIRVLNHTGVSYLKGLIPPGDDFQTDEDLIEVLSQNLLAAKDDVLYLTAIDDEADAIVGYILCFVHPRRDHVVVFASHFGELDVATIRRMQNRVLLWTEQVEMPEIRFDDFRNSPKRLKWPSTPHTTIYSVEVAEAIEPPTDQSTELEKEPVDGNATT